MGSFFPGYVQWNFSRGAENLAHHFCSRYSKFGHPKVIASFLLLLLFSVCGVLQIFFKRLSAIIDMALCFQESRNRGQSAMQVNIK